MKNQIYTFCLSLLLTVNLASCQSDDAIITESNTNAEVNDADPDPDADVEYLALGDSYTIGQSVCATCRFPVQLTTRFNETSDKKLSVDIIAATGWRTDDLLYAIKNANPSNQYELVTLLIGVNNQYQGIPIDQYKTEFLQLLDKAKTFARGDKSRVIVVSIPDYAFTPFGQNYGNPQLISQEIDAYNAFAKSTTEDAGITYLNITDITRRGLDEPNLVAQDGLHPSEKAYAEFVERLLPMAQAKLNKD